ncbi:MAG: hypothetical protein KIB43_07895 [Clostridium baratii]|uniref:hypothetical protein n=1 Tax=Clostridium baratii TaxID=1561 RepID=UPI0024308E92|nr:hypothetical protein [Clostridium baratii]MBS6006870.1 hypothetical protein [Clostridium baratii]
MYIFLDLTKLTAKKVVNGDSNEITFILLDNGELIDLTNKKFRLIIIMNNLVKIIDKFKVNDGEVILDTKDYNLNSGYYTCQLEINGLNNYLKYSSKFEIEYFFKE